MITVLITIPRESKTGKVDLFNETIESPVTFPFTVECMMECTAQTTEVSLLGNASLAIQLDSNELIDFLKSLKTLTPKLDEFLKDEKDGLFLAIGDKNHFRFATNKFVDRNIMDNYLLPLYNHIKKFPHIQAIMIARNDTTLDTYYHPAHFLTTLRELDLSFKNTLSAIHISHNNAKLVLGEFLGSEVYFTRLLHLSFEDWAYSRKTYAELFDLYQSLTPQPESVYKTEHIYVETDFFKTDWSDEFLEAYTKLATVPYVFKLPKFDLTMSRRMYEIRPPRYNTIVDPFVEEVRKFNNWTYIAIRVS